MDAHAGCVRGGPGKGQVVVATYQVEVEGFDFGSNLPLIGRFTVKAEDELAARVQAGIIAVDSGWEDVFTVTVTRIVQGRPCTWWGWWFRYPIHNLHRVYLNLTGR